MNTLANKMDANLTGMWVTFFTAAGIPSDVSATYALTFSENRIQNDMLLDLNKEYLRDMGISRMGDVIAILRHAKQVHEMTARDKVLSTTAVSNKVPVATVAAVAGRAAAQPSSPASRILEHYTRNVNSPEKLSSVGVKLKRKSSIDVGTEMDTTIKKSRLIRFESPTRISTASKETASKNTVFSRLGNSESVKADSPQPAAKKIFLRLGSKTDSDTVQDIPMQKDALKYEGILKSPPAKELPSVNTKKVFTVTTRNNQRKIAIATMRADEAPVSVKEKLALPKVKSVKFSSQVQYKEIEKEIQKEPSKPTVVHKFTTVFNKPERRLSMPEGAAGVKARLGTKSVNNFTITKNIFNRLGAQ